MASVGTRNQSGSRRLADGLGLGLGSGGTMGGAWRPTRPNDGQHSTFNTEGSGHEGLPLKMKDLTWFDLLWLLMMTEGENTRFQAMFQKLGDVSPSFLRACAGCALAKKR